MTDDIEASCPNQSFFDISANALFLFSEHVVKILSVKD